MSDAVKKAAVKKEAVEKAAEESKLKVKADAEAAEDIYAAFSAVSNTGFMTGSNDSFTKDSSPKDGSTRDGYAVYTGSIASSNTRTYAGLNTNTHGSTKDTSLITSMNSGHFLGRPN